MSFFTEVLGAAAPLGGGVVVVTFALALVGWVLRQRYRTRLAALKRAKPGDIPAMVGDELDKLKISAQPLDPEQQFTLVKEALRQRERRSQRLMLLSVLVSLLLSTIAVVGITSPAKRQSQQDVVQPTKEPSSCARSDLSLTMEVAGNLIPGRHEPPPGHYASGRLYQFTLTNTSSTCTVIVKDITLAVLAGVVDHHPAMEATTADNQYEVVLEPSSVGKRLALTPLEGAPRATWNYNYTPRSAPDRFSVQVVPHAWGFSYAIQFVVTWYDPSNRQSFLTESSVYAAFFPDGGGLEAMGSDAWPFRRRQAAAWTQALGKPVLLDVHRGEEEE